jgi:hypothetical protein
MFGNTLAPRKTQVDRSRQRSVESGNDPEVVTAETASGQHQQLRIEIAEQLPRQFSTGGTYGSVRITSRA